MKMLILSAMLFVAASSFTTIPVNHKISNATTTGCFDFVRSHRQGKNVVLTWSVSSPGVTQFVIERSYDGQYFDPINSVPGAQGTSSFKDQSAFPGYIYYRITAQKSDGSSETSAVEMVRIVAH